MDTVWTTVKVRRSVLSDAAALMPGLSNSAIVQTGLERILGTPSAPLAAHRPAVTQRASNERADGETGAGTMSHRPSPSSIPGQTTVDEMLASCPQCAGEFADGRCVDCGFVREPEGT